MSRFLRRRSGFTLTELTTATAISLVIILAVGAMFVLGIESHKEALERDQAAQDRRTTLAVVTAKLSQAELPLRQAYNDQIEWRLDDGSGEPFHMLWVKCDTSTYSTLRYSTAKKPFSRSMPPSRPSSTETLDSVQVARMAPCAESPFAVSYEDAAGRDVVTPTSGSPFVGAGGNYQAGMKVAPQPRSWLPLEADTARTTRFTVPHAPARVNSIEAFIRGRGTGSQELRAVIYSNGSTYHGKSDPVTVSAGSAGTWVKFPVSENVTLNSAATYRIGLHAGDSDGVAQIASMASPGRSSRVVDEYDDGPAATFPSGEHSLNHALAIRANLGMVESSPGLWVEESGELTPRLGLTSVLKLSITHTSGQTTTATSAVGSSGVRTATSLIPNGDFEAFNAGQFPSWTANPTGAVSRNGTSGSYSATLSPAAVGNIAYLTSDTFLARGDAIAVTVQPLHGEAVCHVELVDIAGESLVKRTPMLATSTPTTVSIDTKPFVGRPLMVRLGGQNRQCRFSTVGSVGDNVPEITPADSYAELVMESNPVGYWRMDDEPLAAQMLDSSGNALHGTHETNVLVGRGTGLIRDVDGSSVQYAAGSRSMVPNNPALQLSTVTIDGWVNPTSATAFQTIMAKPAAWGLSIYNGEYVIWDWGSASMRSFGVPVVPGQTAYVALIARSGVTNGTELWLNGELAGRVSMSVGNQTHPFGIGSERTSTGSGNPFTGRIDEVSLIGRALTADEIMKRYQRGRAAFAGYASTVLSSPGLQGYWRLNDRASSVALDASIHGRHGTYAGAGDNSGLPPHRLGVVGLIPTDTDTAVAFDGSRPGSGVVLPNHATFSSSTITVDAWIQMNDLSAGLKSIVVKQGAYGMFIHNGNLLTHDWSAGGDRPTSTFVADGKPHHVALVVRSGVANSSALYVDGRLVLSTTITYLTTANAPAIGAGNSALSGQNFTGVIDEVTIHNQALSSAQIAARYQAGMRTM